MTSMMSASTADDTTQQSLPSFTSFSAELEPSWDYYEQRPERSNSATNGSTDVIASQTTANGSYTRPWEMDTKDNRMAPPHGPPGTPGPPPPPTPSGGFDHGGFPKLPSFQSQFHSFTDTAMVTPEPSLPQVTAVPVPISPSSASPGTGGSLTQLTQLTPTPLPPLPQSGFHTLSAVNSRPYPIVPAAIPVRDLAGINHHQHQYIDERHIQLYQPMATFQGQTIPTLAVIKKEMVDYEMTSLNNGTTLHHSNFQNPLLDNGLFAQNGTTVHHIQHQPAQLQHHLAQQHQQQQQQQATIVQHQPQLQLHHQHNLVTPSDHHHNNNNNNGAVAGPTTPSSKMSTTSVRLDPGTPAQITRIDNRKKERRKIRAPSLESSAESEGSAMEIGESGNPGQVAAISSTANFKSPMHTMSMDTDDGGTPGEKSTKKKRKRCGECVGCSRKDNCGDCAPCRNDKSHQICKTRRCEKLTEKKILYGPDGQLLKPESRRGRGKGSKAKAAAAAAAAAAAGATNGSANGAIVSYDANGQAIRAEGKRGRGRGRGGGSGRGRKALNLGATPKNVPQNSAVSPAPASLPHPSPNTTTGAPSTPNVQVPGNQSQQQQQQQLVTVSGAQTGTAAPPTAANTAAPGVHNSALLGSGPSQHQHQQQQHQQQAQLQHHLARHPPIPGAPPPGGGGGGPGNLQQQQQQQQHQSIIIKSEPSVEVMKDQPQQPMAPMAFYPTWQADPSQGWQNQFIQQIPQNTPAITPLNSLEFQPQGYAAYQPNGYVQTAGIGFDPNYGRTYAAPPAVQRYDFQANQIAPINQVSLQSVSFAPTVTYAGQVSTGPATIVSGHAGNNPHDQFNLQLGGSKQQQQQSSTTASATSGNDMPGYPRVNSVPPRSLNCNGYSGQQDYGGLQTSTTTTTTTAASANGNSNSTSSASASSSPSASTVATAANAGNGGSSSSNSTTTNNSNNNNNGSTGSSSSMHPPQGVPQSPNRQPPRPNSNQQLYAQQSPNPYNGGSSGGGSLQQSPSHNGNNTPVGYGSGSGQSGMHTPSPMQQGTPTDNQHQQSPSHMQSDWGWNQQQQQSQQSGADLFNQSDRVNLNSRLKTMIMNKGDQKDALLSSGGQSHMGSHLGLQQQQQQQQTGTQQSTGHFLSYSHHLRDSLTPTHLGGPGPGTPGQQQQSASGAASGGPGMMAGGTGSGNSSSSTANEGTTIGDGGGSGLINSIGNIVDPSWKHSQVGGAGSNSSGSGANNGSSSHGSTTSVAAGMKSPSLTDHHHHHHQLQQHDHLLAGDLHHGSKHSVFEQKQQLIDKNNTDPGGGGGGGGIGSPTGGEMKGKMGKSGGSSSSSSSGSPSAGSPSSKAKGKGGDKHGKSKHGGHGHHGQQQQHPAQQQHHLDHLGQGIVDTKSSSYSSSSSNFMMHHDQQLLQQQQNYTNMNQTYPGSGGSTTPNGSQTSGSLLGYSPAGASSMMVDSKLVDDKSPLNRFRHDSLSSGFNPHLQTGGTGTTGAFHHPGGSASQTSGSGYNLMSVKKEPGLLDDGQSSLPKFDGGYEKNYQNFIRYGDYCDNTQSAASQASVQASGTSVKGASSDYNSYYSPYGSYSSYSTQNYPNYHNQQTVGGGFGSGSASNSNSNSSLPPAQTPESNALLSLPAISTPVAHQTNFEQQIPAHTYPIPKNNSLLPASDPVSIKLEADDSAYGSMGNNSTNLGSDPGSDPGVGNQSSGAGGTLAEIDVASGNQSGTTASSGTTATGGTTATTNTTTSTSTSTGTKSKSKKGEKKDKSKDNHGEGADGKAEGASTGGGKSKSKKESKNVKKEPVDPAQKADDDKLEKSHKPEAPDCDCFSSGTDKAPSEPGSYYTHLGCAATLEDLRRETELRVGLTGKQLRIEKVVYTGKEGKSSQGCPIAKWVIRRVDPEEKLLFVVKRRQGHRCKASFIVICIVVWDGIPNHEADSVYRMLAVKLNKFGLPTVRRCATNENRTCACQGLDPELCGVSYSFGCSWSMYYNGCKYARSKTVRKFRLSVKNEEAEIEERMNVLATMLSPLYVTVAPQAFQNQVQYEREAPDCRLGLKPGKPFSGVTCCLDFCAHTHRDLHNMQDGCTVQVTLLKPLPPGVKPDDEQLHVLPLYTMDTTDEFDSEEGQKKKHETGAVQVLEKFQTEVRVRSTPLQPCRRHGKKRGNGKDEKLGKDGSDGAAPDTPPPPPPPTKKESKSKSKKSSAASTASNSGGSTANSVASPGAGGSGSAGAGGSSGSGSPRAHTPGSQKSTGSGKGSNNTTLDPVTGVLTEKHSSPLHGQGGAIGGGVAGGLVAGGNGGSGSSAFTAPNTINSPNSVANNNTNSTLIDMASMIDNFTDAQLQSNQISSTVLDSPYSYDYNTGQYIDNRQYYNNWPTDYYGNRGDPSKLAGLGRNEEIPDTTTRPGSNSSNSAFSPSIPDPTKTPTPIHMDDYGSTKLNQGQVHHHHHQLQQQQQQQQQQQHQQQHQQHQQQHQQQTQQQTQNTYHTLQQPEQGFVKPKPPDYNPAAGYGYHHPNTPMGYGYHHHHHPPYHHTPYDPYQNYNYGYPPQSYHHHHHTTYHNMYPAAAAAAAAAQTQLPGTGPAPPPPPTAVIPAPPPPSNWNLYPPHLGSAPTTAQLHVAAAAAGALGKQSDLGAVGGGPGGLMSQSVVPPQAPAPPPPAPLPPKETLGEVTETNENLDCFEDPQMGGVAIALPHGSVIIECAKLEMHSTTAVKKPNRLNPTRMTLIFYQHRNLNRPKHGIAEWAEKMRLKKLGIPTNDPLDDKDMLLEDDIKAEPLDELHHMRHMGDEHDMMDVEYPGV